MPDIQKKIDELLAKYPQALQYVDYVRYVPQGQAVPTDATETLRLISVNTGQEIVLAIRAKAEIAFIVEMLLSVL
jgi:hypothetical protein